MSRTLILTAVLLLLAHTPAEAQKVKSGQFLGKSVQAWQTELVKGDDAARRSAAFALGKIGSPAMGVVPELKKHLRDDKDARVREAVAFALGEIAGDSIKSDPDLVKTLGDAIMKDASPMVRRSAAYALGRMGSNATGGLAPLAMALNDPNPAVRQNAAWALGKVGPESVPALQKALRDSDVLVKRDAAASLGSLPPEAVRPALPDLFEMCKANNSEARRAALAVLIKVVGPSDAAGASAVQACLKDRDDEVRNHAALTLSNIGGEEGAAAVPQLMQAVRTGDVEVRRQAAAAIRNIGPAARKAVPELIKALRDADEEVRGNAALALAGIGPDAEPAYRALADLVENPRERAQTRVEAAVALSRIGDVPASIPAIPGLLKVVANPAEDGRVRERIIWALRVHNARLRQIPEVYPAFTKVLSEPRKDDNRMLRFDCAFMLGMLQGPAATTEVLTVLHEFLKDDSIQIYVGTKVAVGAVGIETTQGKSESKEVGKGDGRIMAVRALHQIGPERVSKHAGIVAELRSLAANSTIYADLRIQARELLKDIGK